MTINWTNAATAATADFDEAVQKAAATLIMGVDDLMANPSTGRPAKLAVLQQLGAMLTNQDTLIAFLTGQATPKTPKALGGGSPSGDPDEDLTDRLDAAEAENAKLKANQQTLLTALGKVFGATIGLTDGRVSRTLPADVDVRLGQIQHAAASGAGVIPKMNVKAKLDELKTALDAVSTTTMSNKVVGLDAAKNKLTEVSTLVS